MVGIGSAFGQHDPLKPFQGKIGRTVAETEQHWPAVEEAPADAPNVIWILLDDVGFGAASAFGGLIETPNFDFLANDGLRYTNFHNAAICGPTRAALLTGRNHHKVGVGHHPDWAFGTPGYNGNIPFEAGLISEALRENGYRTFAIGKWHSTRPDQITPAGPFNRWPTGRGFDFFYGFMQGATDQWHPELYDGIAQLNLEPNTKHLNQLITDKAIEYIANLKSMDPDKPFFMFYAPGATHAPAQVAKEWIEQYTGRFDEGWDDYREVVFNRQKAMGILPEGTRLPPRQEGLKPWNSLSKDEQRVLARFMEVYAGYLSYTDHEIGRLIDFLRHAEQLENTAIFLIIGDNGATKEGSYMGRAGTRNGFSAGDPDGEGLAYLMERYDELGSERTYPTIPLGWAHATNTPFQYWKSDANGEGGSHAPLIVYYPKKLQQSGMRQQYSHVIDLLPTTLELTGATYPDVINGYPQMPLQGISLVYSFDDSTATSKRQTQYYEIHTGRAIYHEGWKAAVYHPKTYVEWDGTGEDPRDVNFRAPLDVDGGKWKLYHLDEDWTETEDLADRLPDKLDELKALFEKEAAENNVYPLRSFHEGTPKETSKPSVTIFGKTTARIPVVLDKKTPIRFAADVELSGEADTGIIFAHGDLFGGAALFIKDGQLNYVLNRAMETVSLTAAMPAINGRHEIRISVDKSNIEMAFDGTPVATKPLPGARGFLGNTTQSKGITVGQSMDSPVLDAYTGPFAFTGEIIKLVITQPDAD